MRHRERGRTNEGRLLRQEAQRRRPGPGPRAGCRKQGQGVRTQARLQTQPGPMDPERREGTKTPGRK